MTRYSIDFWRVAVDKMFDPAIKYDRINDICQYYTDLTYNKKEDFTSLNHLKIKVLNNTRLKNNFNISIKDIA